MKQTIDVLAQDAPGVLMRVAGIITAKGLNIEAVTVRTDPERPGFSRIRLVAESEARLRIRVIHEMNRLVQVLQAAEVSLTEDDTGDGLPPV